MSWRDRLKEAAYNSPSGRRLRFTFVAVSLEVAKRTTEFQFPGVDGAYVQDNGFGARRFPLRCIFNGPDHDVIAEAFVDLLLEQGTGRLEHPLYGTFDVVPFGDITRRNDLVESANETIVEVTFFETLRVIYPRLQADPRGQVLTSIDAYALASAAQFEAQVDVSTIAAKANVRARFQGFLSDVSATLDSVAAVESEVNSRFRDAQREVNFGIDVLVGQPLQLALKTTNLITGPARAAAGIQSRLDGYGRLADRIVGSIAGDPSSALGSGTVLPGRRRTVANDWHTSVVFGGAAVAGSVLSTALTTFTARPEAIAAAVAIFGELDELTSWMDDGYAAVAEVQAQSLDTGEGYQALQQAVALAAGFLVESSFSLLPERRIVLERARTIIDLAAELYGNVDNDTLDFLIQTNALTGSEILELPRGRSVVYYA